MGRPMAGHMLEAGFDLHVTDRFREGASALEERGAHWYDTPRELAAHVNAVVFMVPDLSNVRDVLAGPDGLLAGVTDELLLIISSTVSPEGVRELGAELKESTGGKVRVVDTPVSGGEEGAVAGSLSIMVGGESPDVELAIRILGPCGIPVHLGPLGAGQVAKACNQLIVAAGLLANAEAAIIAERAGLDLAKLFNLLKPSYSGSRIMEVKSQRFIDNDFTPSGAARFLVKDLAFATDAARSGGTATPLLDVLRAAYVSLTEAGMGDQDTSVVKAWVESLDVPEE